jgi:hypothetical protein
MSRGVPRKATNLLIKPMIEQILSAGHISRQEHLRLTSAMLSDFELTDEDRRNMNRIFDYIQANRLKIID